MKDAQLMQDEITVSRGAPDTTTRSVDRAPVSYQQHPSLGIVTELNTLLTATADLRHVHKDSFPTKPDARLRVCGLSGWQLIASETRGDDYGEVVLEADISGSVAMIDVRDGRAHVKVSARTRETAESDLTSIRHEIGAPPPDQGQTRVMFWAKSKDDARCTSRDIEAPTWDTIAPNYSETVRTGMGRLLDLDACPDARLVLWHGPPGTGETHALRALSRAWAPWCSTHYIADPEKFLSDVASYLLEVVAHRERFRPPTETETKLIVLEDAGELMSPAARQDSGQDLS
jgi:hypothetical protein